MAIKQKVWRAISFVLMVALVFTAVPVLTANAQEAVTATRVRGELNEQFAKHYLEIRANNPREKMNIVMEFNPNDNQNVRQFSGFIVLDENQVNQLNNTAPRSPSLRTTARDANETVSGVVRKVANFDGGTYTLVVFNDSTVPMDYTLSGENIIFIDESGEQVTDPSAPIVADEETDEDADEDAAEAAPAATTTTPVATATVTATATATATPATVAVTSTVVVPTKFTASDLEGELTEQFGKHYFDLEVQDIKTPVEVEMTYDPQDAQELENKLNFYVLDDGQFRALVNGSATNLSLNNTLVGELLPPSVRSVKTKYGRISQPFNHYVVIVSNDSKLPATYQLSVKNALLVDESAQSITAQELVSTEVVTTTVTTASADTTSAAPAATTAAAPAASTGSNAITPPTTYTVQSGDTMGTISRRAYGTSQLYAQLCAHNNITNCNRIEVGDTINIPVRSELPSTVTTAPAATPTPAAAAATTPAAATPEPTAAPAAAATTEAPAATTNTAASGNLVTTASSFNVLDTLGLLLDLLELEPDQNNNVKAVLNSGTYTFFAPTDTAFTSLNEAQLEQLIANPAQLAGVLKFHVVPGTFTAADLASGTNLDTLSGTSLPVSVANGVVSVGGAQVVQADIPATNGVIHIIDSVLLPGQ